jgi:hypothetical protein
VRTSNPTIDVGLLCVCQHRHRRETLNMPIILLACFVVAGRPAIRVALATLTVVKIHWKEVEILSLYM